MSRIGKKPVELPGGVSATVSGQTIEVKGPKGTRAFTATDDVALTVEDTGPAVIDETRWADDTADEVARRRSA